MKPILTFDLNGTITDTGALDPLFASAFGSAERRHEWYMQLIELAMACTASGQFIEFSKLSEAAIHMLAERYHVSLTGEQSAAFMDRIRSLPAFPEVKGALEKLRANGYRLVVLTNSSLRGGESTLQSGGIAEYFERILSVEMVQTYKPWPQVYQSGGARAGGCDQRPDDGRRAQLGHRRRNARRLSWCLHHPPGRSALAYRSAPRDHCARFPRPRRTTGDRVTSC